MSDIAIGADYCRCLRARAQAQRTNPRTIFVDLHSIELHGVLNNSAQFALQRAMIPRRTLAEPLYDIVR